MTVSSAWYVKIVSSGLSYITSESGSDINFRANSFSDATMVFNDSAGDYTNVFSEETEVQIYIGDPAGAGVKMLHGYIVSITTERSPKRERTISLYIIDWGAYLAAKRSFEKRYFSSATAQDVLNDTLSSVTDGVDTLTGSNIGTIGGTIKQFFEGTSVKDVWNIVAETCKCDYFVNESLDLNAFLIGSKFLTTGGSTYKLQDTVSGSSNQIMIRHDFPYEFTSDVSQKIRNVTVTNGLMQTFPDVSELNQLQLSTYVDGKTYGKEFSSYYIMGAFSDYNVDTVGTSLDPIAINTADQIGTQTIPSITLKVASGTSNADVTIQSHTATTVSDLNITINDWEEIGFWIKNSLSGVAMTSFYLYLFDTALNYWRINLFSYLSSSWRLHRLSLPSTSSNSEVYTGGSWTKTGSPTKINWIYFAPTPLSGYTAGTSLSFAQLHLYTLRKKSATAAGNPPTQKIIVDGTQTHPDQLQTFATSEQARLNTTAKQAVCTFTGNTDFKRPGYLIDVDFSTTLGTGRSGTGASGLRMDTIKHFLQSGFHFTTVNLNNSFHRP